MKTTMEMQIDSFGACWTTLLSKDEAIDCAISKKVYLVEAADGSFLFYKKLPDFNDPNLATWIRSGTVIKLN